MQSLEPFFSRGLHMLRDWRLYLPNPTFANPRWEEADFRLLIVRLSPFADVERSTPHLFLAAECRAALPDAFLDMAFLPCPRDASLMAHSGLPLLVGTQSHRTLEEFDLVFVSNAWLLEEVNLPYLLARSGCPTWAADRGEGWPPIVLGGSNVTAAHALVSETGNCMADALFFGEGEGTVGRIAGLFRRERGVPKRERVARVAAEVPGLWPWGDLGAGTRKAVAGVDALLDALAGPGGQGGPGALPTPLLPGAEAATARLSITRGCPCLCSFCFEGFDRKPYRELPAAALLSTAREIKRLSGADTLEIDSFNFNTHSEIAPLLVGLHRLFLHVNLMSQRVDVLARTPGLLALEIAAGKASFTLGIEGISAGMRAFLHKSLPTDDIRVALEALHRARTREIKLFYLLTGRESADDSEEFAGFVKDLKRMRERAESLPRVVFSFGMLVRMPFTPLRYDAPVLDEAAWKPIVGRVKSACETHGFEFRLSLPWPDYAATQVLALGGHSLSGLLERLAEEGAVTDAGLGPGARRALNEWTAGHRGELEGEKPPGHPFGFPFLDDGKTRAMLYRQFERAKERHDTGYALAPGRRAPQASSVRAAAADLGPLMDKKRRLVPVLARVLLPREAAGMGARWAEAALMRALLEAHPGEIDNLLGVREALVEPTGILPPDLPWHGTTIAALTAWDTARMRAVLGPDALAEGRPGPAVTVRLRICLPGALFPDPVSSLAAFLRDAHAPVTVTREDGQMRFLAAEKTLRKRMLLSGTCARAEDGHVLDLTVGGRPFLGEWLAEGYEEGASRRALAEILAIS